MFSKYIFFGCQGNGFYKVAYSDLSELENADYYDHPFDACVNVCIKFLGKLVFKPKFNRLFPSFIERLLYRNIINSCTQHIDSVCYVIFPPTLFYLKPEFISEIRKIKPDSKVVIYFQDIIRSYSDWNAWIPQLRKISDLIITYDKTDAEEFGFKYFPTPFSMVEICPDNNIPLSDVYFCGKAKTRFDTIIEVYKKLAQKGLICDFYIYGVNNKDRIVASGLHYDEPLSYYNNLQHIQKTKCLLEIMQEGAVGFTPRLWESVWADKHLLTNNSVVSKVSFYDSDAIHFIETDLDLIDNWINEKISYGNSTKQSLSPKKLLRFIDQFFLSSKNNTIC